MHTSFYHENSGRKWQMNVILKPSAIGNSS